MSPTIRFDRLDTDAAVYTLTHADGTTEDLRQPYTRAAPHYRDGEPVWQWDGNTSAPTLTPSFHHTTRGIVVHLWLKTGRIQVCADSDAELDVPIRGVRRPRTNPAPETGEEYRLRRRAARGRTWRR